MIERFNLIYHLTAVDNNDTWLKNLAQLRRRWHLFNGRRIISVATGPGLVPLQTVKRFLPDPSIEWLTFPNCARMREATSFYPMLRMLGRAATEATFYAHAKGVTRNACDLRVRDWRNQMYAHLLDRMDDVRTALASHPCVGAYRQRHWPGTLRSMGHLAPELRNMEWHYAGTFWWFRNDLLNQPKAFAVPMSGYAVEFYLPHLVGYDDAPCLYRDNPPDPYRRDHESCPDPTDWPAVFLEPTPVATPATPAAFVAATRVELGGGMNPRAGFVNVDLIDSADVRLDLEAVGRGEARLPFADESVDEFYSSHCLEHVRELRGLLPEIARVCRLGASVEMRTPHEFNSMAICYGHVHTISETQVRHWCELYTPYWFADAPRRLRLDKVERKEGEAFLEAARLFPHLAPDQLMRFIPNACHETRFFMTVVPNP